MTLLNFVNALAGAYDGPISFDLDGAAVTANDANTITSYEGQAYLVPLQESGVAPFVFGIMTEAGPEDWRETRLPTTAVLTKDDTHILLWAFETPQPLAVVQPLFDVFESAADEPVPTPGANGWTLTHLDPDTFHDVQAFADAYEVTLGEVAAEPADEAVAVADDMPEILDDEPTSEDEEIDDYSDLEDEVVANEDAPPFELEPPVAEPVAAPVKAKAKRTPKAKADEPVKLVDLGRYADAVMRTPYDEANPALQQMVTVTVGASSDSYHWAPKEMPVGAMMALLCQHKVGKKDGMAWVLGDMVAGKRAKDAVKSLTAVGLDIDTGMSGAEIDRHLVKLNRMAVRYTTHSHMKGETRVKKDLIIKWAEKNRPDDTDLENPETIRAYLREAKRYDASIADTAEVADYDHGERGIEAVIEHAPMPKHRVILPLATAFEVAKEAKTQRDALEKWRKVPRALARQLGDLPIDSTGSDPNRLFYLPRHGKDSPFEVTLFGGELLDWRALELDDAWEVALESHEASSEIKKGKSVTEAGKELGRTWAKKAIHGFAIADVIRDHATEKVRSDNGSKLEIECPFDDDHSNAGDEDDRACFVVNAGEGTSEVFTISCRHDGCRNKTNLDMLGKMVTDNWFGRDVIDDESYNAVASMEPATPQEVERKEQFEKAVHTETAQAEYASAIDALNSESPGSKIAATIKIVLESKLDSIDESKALTRLRKAVAMTDADFKKEVKGAKSAMKAEEKKEKKQPDRYDEGRLLFNFSGDIDQHNATESCMKVLLKENEKKGVPYFANLDQRPVRLVASKTGRMSYAEVSTRALWSELNKRIVFVRMVDENATEAARAFVPKEVGDQVYETAFEHLPPSPEIIYTPIFDSRGDLIHKPGYYEAEGLLIPALDFEVPYVADVPTEADVEKAKSLLLDDLLIDFPFLDNSLTGEERREPSQANALAMIMTPFMRRMITGCTPVFFVAKPSPGTGGTFLGKIPLMLFDGEDSAPVPYTDSPEEMAKLLVATALESRSHMFFDDVKGFNNREILRAVTSTQVGGRMLGASKNIEVANRFNWVATGNNPIISNEMERRICWVRLNAQTDDIQKRVFKRENLYEWMMANRSQVIGAILTLIKNWIVLGRPDFTERKQASFEDWARKMGGVLECAGIEGFLDNRRMAEGDMEEASLRSFVKDWWNKFGEQHVTPKALFTFADDCSSDLIDGNPEDKRTQKRFRNYIDGAQNRTLDLFKDDKFITIIKTVDEEKNPVFRLMRKDKPKPAPVASDTTEEAAA